MLQNNRLRKLWEKMPKRKPDLRINYFYPQVSANLTSNLNYCYYYFCCETLTKPWTLEIFRECVLSYDQSQQISRHVSWPENHNLIFIIIPCGLVLLMPDCLFFLQYMFQKYLWCFCGDCGLPVKRSKH